MYQPCKKKNLKLREKIKTGTVRGIAITSSWFIFKKAIEEDKPLLSYDQMNYRTIEKEYENKVTTS